MASRLTLELKVTHSPITTEIRRIGKGLADFYYMLLFTNDLGLAEESATWRSWLRQGFHVDVRRAPDAARESELIRQSFNYGDGLHLAWQIESSNRHAQERLRELLREIDRARSLFTGIEAAERIAALRADPIVARMLIAPMHSALGHAGCSDGIKEFDYAIDRALASITIPLIESAQISLCKTHAYCGS
ncbi:MAG: hypothetical protein ACLQAT_24635 [Candidatus Binataceae bacterium]